MDESTIYEVTGQNQTTELTPAGHFHDVMEVHARSKKHGTHHTVRIPLSEYNPGKVHEVLTRRIGTSDAVSELGG